jgi:hypothetical protein
MPPRLKSYGSDPVNFKDLAGAARYEAVLGDEKKNTN